MGEISKMLAGHNSDITVRGKKYHVQSEDWGTDNPYLVTRVFCNGAVVKTIKTLHQDALSEGFQPNQNQGMGLSRNLYSLTEILKNYLRLQHHQTIDQLMSGTLS